jgi:hypothetical protein
MPDIGQAMLENSLEMLRADRKVGGRADALAPLI